MTVLVVFLLFVYKCTNQVREMENLGNVFILNLYSRQYTSSWHYWFSSDYNPVMAFCDSRLKPRILPDVSKYVDHWLKWMDIRFTGALKNICLCLNTTLLPLCWYNWSLMEPRHWCFLKFLRWFNMQPGQRTIDLSNWSSPASLSNLISFHSLHNLPFSAHRSCFHSSTLQIVHSSQSLCIFCFTQNAFSQSIHLTFQ